MFFKCVKPNFTGLAAWKITVQSQSVYDKLTSLILAWEKWSPTTPSLDLRAGLDTEIFLFLAVEEDFFCVDIFSKTCYEISLLDMSDCHAVFSVMLC